MLVSGFNVYPREVEDALAEHPDVAEVAVIAVAHPYTGEAVKAYVVARVTAELGEEYEELSILDDEALKQRYWEQIPVTLVDGEQHDFWRVSADRLRAAHAR